MSNPIVSVLMTSYNREKYISTAIESVLSSTLRELELIIVDDGSKDRTVQIARSYAEKDSRVRVHQNPKNLGDYPNRNQAASLARGKYLKYVDSDDYMYPWALEIMVGTMEKYPEAGWGLCSMEPNPQRVFPFMLNPREAYEYHYKGPGLFRRAPLSAIIRKDTFDQAGGFNPIRMAGDYEMWHRLAQRFSVVLMPEGMVWYRVHGDQEIRDMQQFIYTYESLKIQYLLSDNCPLDKDTCRRIIKEDTRKTFRRLLGNLIHLNIPVLKINWKILRLHLSVK